MDSIIITQGQPGYPKRLMKRIEHAPKQIYCQGARLKDLLEYPAVAIVGSRNISPYGRQLTYDFARRLAEQGIVIISGLALGVDSLAHEAALAGGGKAIAVLPTRLDNITPRSNRNLAKQILDSGGTLVSEYGPDDPVYKTNFVARNRIVAGLADVLLITEAGERSGTLHTARFALQRKQVAVMAIPNSIHDPHAAGSNYLLKIGATAATSVNDILKALRLAPRTIKGAKLRRSDPHEQIIVDLISKGIQKGEALLEQSRLDVSVFNLALTMLEIEAVIRSIGPNQWAIA